MSTACLKVVLLCKGRGADVKSYKPDRDDSQWWNRRDALVRCVSSTLFSSKRKDGEEITLILIFDEDWSRFEMVYPSGDGGGGGGGGDGNTQQQQQQEQELDAEQFFPTERAVLTLWKKSASKPNQIIVDHRGLSCQLVPPAIPPDQPPSFENKRQVLEFLQNHCSIAFLREQGLNASTSVLLRKSNMNNLLQTWQLWKSQTQTNNNNNKTASSPLDAIFKSLFDPYSNNGSANAIAGILHESSDSELPCFTRYISKQDCPAYPENCHIVLFLGAVRDMHPEENLILRNCCASIGLPLVHLRLGPVPEFTSKIITVAVFHHNNARLGPAMWQLYHETKCHKGHHHRHHNHHHNGATITIPRDAFLSIKKNSATTTTSMTRPPLAELHVMLTLAMDPLQIKIMHDTKQERNRCLWTLVRVVVSTLWRSRLAGTSASATTTKSSSSSRFSHTATNFTKNEAAISLPLLSPPQSQNGPLKNTLTIIFQDQSSVTLQQHDLVKSMADQHQAAPSEYQIIQAIHDKLRVITPSENELLIPIQTRLRSIIRKGEYAACLDLTRPYLVAEDQEAAQAVILDMVDRCYKSHQDSNMGGKVIIMLGDHERSKILAKEIRQSARMEPIPIRMIHPDVVDYEAASVVMIQHFMYQHRLLPILKPVGEQVSSDRKNKKPRTK